MAPYYKDKRYEVIKPKYMGKYKDEHKKSRLGAFIKNNAPKLLDAVEDVLPDRGALGVVKNLITNSNELTPEEKEAARVLAEMDLNAFELEVEDRKSARLLYSTDDIMQKVFAGVFLVGYMALSYYLLRVLMGAEDMPKLAETMVTMIWTGTSTKLGTIVDFFFGGSVSK
jgi:hypothetical protein